MLLLFTLVGSLIGGVACGPGQAPGTAAPSPEAPLFDFKRTREAVLKLDSSSGGVWFTDISGEGDWIAIGTPPDAAGEPNVAGRYSLMTIQSPRASMAPRMADPTTVMLLDQATGRVWISAVRRDASWKPVAERPGAEG